MTGKRLRCAIYTRKSSEEGLDQAFNSLHAQREACEAYVLSQVGEGWSALKAVYDDGGFSGGTMERPGLKRLLADVVAGRVDVVVVYKVDRLTRSLADFAKIVEQFDAAGVSFVSVTQAFNTTSSMGRLTLNVLLSFAQFEREVTGERIRDKIAASKAKGMWMGGSPPLGYDKPVDLATRALVVNEAEAETVRLIFRRYLELGSAHLLARWLDEQAIRSKVYVSAKGLSRGGAAYNRGALFHLLKNRLYLGEIVHKGAAHPGAHPGIVDAETFAAAQDLITSNARAHKAGSQRVARAPLKGLVFDAEGSVMSPSFAFARKDRVYRYYVSAPLQQGARRPPGDETIRRVRAEPLEELVLDRLSRFFRSGDTTAWAAALPLLDRVEVLADAMVLVIRADRLPGGSDIETALAYARRRLQLEERAAPVAGSYSLLRVTIPARLKLRGGRTWILGGAGKPTVVKSRVDRKLVAALRVAHSRVRQVERSAASIRTRYERRLTQLAFLAPEIQSAILEGRQPAGLNLQRLIHDDASLAWVDQIAALGT